MDGARRPRRLVLQRWPDQTDPPTNELELHRRDAETERTQRNFPQKEPAFSATFATPGWNDSSVSYYGVSQIDILHDVTLEAEEPADILKN